MSFDTQLSFSQDKSQLVQAAALALTGMIAVVGSALAFEHMGGYVPCALCLEQRNPYYWGIPFVALGVLAGLLNWPACILRGALVIALLCLIATALLGAYHAGVEWGYFPAPSTCGAGVSVDSSDAGNLLSSLNNSKPPSCDAAAGRFLGISFAGWNFLAAIALAIAVFKKTFVRRH